MTTDVTRCAKKSRGRPKVFDRDAALDKAMTLFWQHGYEATSLSDLVEATGAKAPTLYAEFTNKEGLFRAVLDRYISRFAAKHEAQLFCEEKRLSRHYRIISGNRDLLYQQGHACGVFYDQHLRDPRGIV